MRARIWFAYSEADTEDSDVLTSEIDVTLPDGVEELDETVIFQAIYKAGFNRKYYITDVIDICTIGEA